MKSRTPKLAAVAVIIIAVLADSIESQQK